ncbi:unnamed protein product [Coffea canephora]|uniref:Uncharacterized protein n=1 Tax=Coffea canephora TaxID=49390 RepID=A0A068TWC8_COFCA|nr:unnamed protein product [Coffea canephora]
MRYSNNNGLHTNGCHDFAPQSKVMISTARMEETICTAKTLRRKATLVNKVKRRRKKRLTIHFRHDFCYSLLTFCTSKICQEDDFLNLQISTKDESFPGVHHPRYQLC